MKFSLTQVFGILAVFAGTVFATFTAMRHLDSTSYEASMRTLYVDALIRDFSREADFLATQIEAAKADSARLVALLDQAYASDANPEALIAMLRAEMGPVVDGRNPFGMGIIGSFRKDRTSGDLPGDIRTSLASILELQDDIRYETDRVEWIVAQNMAWSGDPSKTDLENETTRTMGLLLTKRHALDVLTQKRRLLLTETTQMLALLNQTHS